MGDKGSVVSNEQLIEIRDDINKQFPGRQIRAWQIRDAIASITGTKLDESTIRGRFIEMGQPLSGGSMRPNPKVTVPESSKTERGKFADVASYGTFTVEDDLKRFIPTADMFTEYVERPIDKRLAIHYNLGKYPLTQGKQGTGKTFGHMYYAYKSQLPLLLLTGYEDFDLKKHYGDKTIVNGSIVFQESDFVKFTQSPSLIVVDEVNAIPNEGTFDFHGLLVQREILIKEANDGKGKVYKLHPECRIGFSQNPKSAKYIGGSIKPSNFLGRCTYITYPEFKKKDIREILSKRHPTMSGEDLSHFTEFYFAVTETIERSGLPVDVSIRQLNNVVDLWVAGLPLKESIEDGLSSILEAVSQPQAKESILRLAQAVWKELM